MNGFDGIIKQLEAHRAAIEKALAALREVEGIAVPAASAPANATAKRRGRPAKKKGGMTEAGREKLREAMKRRWAVKRTAAQAKKRGRPKKAA
jgi:succinate dehydrogenase/fumarate reductase flavoprotein subunit